MRVFAALVRLGAGCFFDPVGFAGPHRVCDRDLPARFVLVPDLAFGEHHVVSFAPASGDRATFCASPSSSFWTARQAAWMAQPTEETVNDPPSTGASGSAESPSFAVTFSRGTPSISAAS